MQSKVCLINADKYASQFCDDNGAINMEKLTVFVFCEVN